MVDEIVILLIIGFVLGFYIRHRRAKGEQFQLHQQIVQLKQDIGVMHEAESQRQQKSERYRQQQAVQRQQQPAEEIDISDPQHQLALISQCDLRPVRPVNREASTVLYALEDWIAAHQPEWRFSFEVGMGAFIKTPSDQKDKRHKAAFSCYNSKRVDFLLIDRGGQPMLAIEYHGSGHYLSDDAESRMMVKRAALERAGIPLLEIEDGAKKSKIVTAISATLGSAVAAR